MRVTADVNIGINYLRIVSQPLNLAAFFATATGAVRQINGVQDLTVVIPITPISAKPQKQQSRIRRVSIFNAQLPCQQSSHINAIRAIMPRFVIPSNDSQNLVRDGLDQVHHRRQFFHRREVGVRIAQTGLQCAVKQIASKHTVRIVMRVYIINVLAYSIVIRMRVSVVIISKDE